MVYFRWVTKNELTREKKINKHSTFFCLTFYPYPHLHQPKRHQNFKYEEIHMINDDLRDRIILNLDHQFKHREDINVLYKA